MLKSSTKKRYARSKRKPCNNLRTDLNTFAIENENVSITIRRGKVLSMLAHSKTGVEIARELNVHESTVSRDIQYLKEQSQQFVYDFAKSDLAFYYQQALTAIDVIKRELWLKYEKKKDIALLKLLKECEETRFMFLEKGPYVMKLKMLEDKLNRFENSR